MRFFATLLLASCSAPVLAGNDHSGDCSKDACSPEGLKISGVVELEASMVDDSIACTVCRNGKCLAPVVVASGGSGKESGGVGCRENAQLPGGPCWGVRVDKAGACFLVTVSDKAFPLMDGDVYTVKIDGHASGTRYVDLEGLTTQYVDYHPTVCSYPENVTCHAATVVFSSGPSGLAIDGGSLVDAGAD